MAHSIQGCGMASRPGGMLRAESGDVRKSFRRFWILAKRVSDEADKDDADIVAAGLAFYGLLGLFPALIAMVSLYGLAADPVAIQNTIYGVARSLPGTARDVLIGELSKFVQRDSRSLSLGMIFGLLQATGIWNTVISASFMRRPCPDSQDTWMRHYGIAWSSRPVRQSPVYGTR